MVVHLRRGRIPGEVLASPLVVRRRAGVVADGERDRIFFFQAEDGIRDVAVTGVQTCALPIAERAYRAAATDSLVGPLAIYRRARVLVRLGDPGADEALAAFAQSYPADTAAPTALYLIGDMRGERGDAAGAARWFGELIARYPVDPRSSVARFRLAFEAARRGLLDSAAALYQSEVTAGAPPRMGAGVCLGELGLPPGGTAPGRAPRAPPAPPRPRRYIPGAGPPGGAAPP